MAEVFLSHSSKDKSFVRKLAGHLRKIGHVVRFDEWDVHVGQSIPRALQENVKRSDFVVVVLSPHSVQSRWVEEEWFSKYWDAIQQRKDLVLPIMFQDCNLPSFLKPYKYADFRSSYERGLVELCLALASHQPQSGIAGYFSDFATMYREWELYFERSEMLDYLAMYSATWRNTYHKFIVEMLGRPNSRLRIVVPDVSSANSELLKVYAPRLGIDEATVRGRLEDAITEYSKYHDYGHVEIYAVDTYLNHAMYLFDSVGVLALYSYRPDRCPTPALLVEQGTLLDFLRADFEWLVSPENPRRRVIKIS